MTERQHHNISLIDNATLIVTNLDSTTAADNILLQSILNDKFFVEYVEESANLPTYDT